MFLSSLCPLPPSGWLVGFRICSSGIIIWATYLPSCSNNPSHHPWPLPSLSPSVPREFSLQKRFHTPTKSLGHPVTPAFVLCVQTNSSVLLPGGTEICVSLGKRQWESPCFFKGSLNFSACVFELPCSIVCSIAHSCC